MIDMNIPFCKELDKRLKSLAIELDITKTQFDHLNTSYRAVGKYLEDDPDFKDYHPIVSPQGSLRLGTIIQPVNDDDDLDVDLVFRLTEKNPSWTQKNIKDKVGIRLASHNTYRSMMDKEGRRCWTLLYRQNTDNVKEQYHMDILPCVADKGHTEYIARMSKMDYPQSEITKIAIRITDKERQDYTYRTNYKDWLMSNPDGYALWFASRCKLSTSVRLLSMEAIMPIGKYTEEKTILQRVVQILKRHRDIQCGSDEDKPISIIITTLAGKAYRGEGTLLEGLCNIIDNMEKFIETDRDGRYIITNPVNNKENFADKWESHPQRQAKFFEWLRKLKRDKSQILNSRGVQLRESLSAAFGKDKVVKIFESATEEHIKKESNSQLKVATTGMLGAIGSKLNASNTFFGEK